MRKSFVLVKPQIERFAERSFERFVAMLPQNGDRAEYSKLATLHRDWLVTFEVAVRDADRPERLASLLRAFAQTYLVSLRFRPLHLAILANCMLAAAGDILNDEWTNEIEEAWDEALHSMLVITMQAARTSISR